MTTHRDSTGTNDAAIGMRLAQAGRFTEALAYLERAHRGDPGNVDVVHAVASLLLASGRFADAARRYEAAAQARPQDSTVLVGWARALLFGGDDEAAIEPLDRALALDPAVAARDGTLRLLWDEDHKERAERILRGLVARHADNVDLLCQFAQVLRATEHLHEAQAQWER